MTNAAFWLCLKPAAAQSAGERIIEESRAACLIDTAERARAAGFGEIVVHTTAPQLLEQLPRGAVVRRSERRASIGAVVAAAAAAAAGPVCYAGAGMPAMTAADWRCVREWIEAGGALANNLHSSDFVAVPDAALLAALGREVIDNGFARRLREDCGLDIAAAAPSAAALLDLDTPADLALLGLARDTGVLEIGPQLSAVLDRCAAQLAPCRARLAAALDLLPQRGRQLMVIGRVGGAVWSALDHGSAARIRVLSEERGMRSRARAHHQPRSLLGLHTAAVGASALIEGLAELADGVLFDTRPLLAHLGWGASRADRFAADLGDPAAISEPPLRGLVRAAAAAPAPIALGGHSLVSGGLLAGIDIAWARGGRPAGPVAALRVDDAPAARAPLSMPC